MRAIYGKQTAQFYEDYGLSRVCIVCKEEAQQKNPLSVHHVMPTSEGGESSEGRNFVYVHANRCHPLLHIKSCETGCLSPRGQNLARAYISALAELIETDNQVRFNTKFSEIDVNSTAPNRLDLNKNSIFQVIFKALQNKMIFLEPSLLTIDYQSINLIPEYRILAISPAICKILPEPTITNPNGKTIKNTNKIISMFKHITDNSKVINGLKVTGAAITVKTAIHQAVRNLHIHQNKKNSIVPFEYQVKEGELNGYTGFFNLFITKNPQLDL